MVNNNICTSCLRALRQQSRLQLQSLNPTRHVAIPTTRSFNRAISTAPSRFADQRPKQPPPPRESKNDPLVNIATTLRTNLRSTTEPYVAFGGTEDLFQECGRQCSYTIPSALASPPAPAPKTAAGEDIGDGTGWWLEPKSKGGLGLETTFNTWAQVIFLHMWLLTVRLRCFPAKYVKDWHQNLLDHFFYAAEERMAMWHGMSARGVRNKYLKDLWAQWRGIMISYDEGLIKGDAVMAAAVWRNIFKADPNVDISEMALVTAYVMRELQMLGRLEDAAVAEGRVKFGDPRSVVRQSLGKESLKMTQRHTEEELKAVEEAANEAVPKK